MGFSGNILFLFCNAVAPEKGGVERWTASMRGEFERFGNACFYLAAKPIWKEFADGERQFFLPDEKRFPAPENAVFFENLLREKQIKIVVYLWADGKRFPFSEVTRRLGVPVIAAIRTDPCFYENRFRGNGPLNRIKRFLRFRRQAKIYRHNTQVCDVTVLLSERFFAGFLKHFPCGKSAFPLTAIPNPSAYDVQAANFSSKKKELLFVGRMEMSVKQPHLLLEIWKKLQTEFPDWSFRMVGGAHDFEKIKALAETLGVKRVHFEGFRDPKDFYRDAAIFCMTSAFEGFPMVLTESAAFGCVPVAFDSFAAVHDIISDKENGRLVPAFDLNEYAKTLAELMRDDALRERLAENARRDVRRYSKEKIVVRWLKLFDELSSKHAEQKTETA